jgi:hypothetical protein
MEFDLIPKLDSAKILPVPDVGGWAVGHRHMWGLVHIYRVERL